MNEVNWLKVIQDVVDRRLTTHLAAERLSISIGTVAACYRAEAR